MKEAFGSKDGKNRIKITIQIVILTCLETPQNIKFSLSICTSIVKVNLTFTHCTSDKDEIY